MIRTLILCLILSSSVYSQGTIQITTEQAREAVRNAQRVQSLELSVNEYSARVNNLQFAIGQLEQSISELEQDRDLWKANYDLLEKRFDAFRAGIVEPKWYEELWDRVKWFLIGAGVGGIIFSF